MTSNFVDEINRIASIDIFSRDSESGLFDTGVFIGRPFHLNYDFAHLLVADAWKQKANGIPQGAFLLAYYEREESVSEALLLRVLRPTKLPTDSDVISSMIEYYKDGLKTSGKESQLDSFTRYEFSFSGMECRVLGTFYKDGNNKLCYGADVENFYSAINYSVVKPNEKVLELIANFREGKVTSKPSDIPIGKVRYSSAMRFQESEGKVPVFVTPLDFLGKRSALFGMTRTGKSNTVKKLIQANVLMNASAPHKLDRQSGEPVEKLLEPLMDDGFPKYPAGQIIFDVNGEYANPNMQDEGTAIYELYSDDVERYSIVDKTKEGFKVLKINFYNEIQAGFKLIKGGLSGQTSTYIKGFGTIDLDEPENYRKSQKDKTSDERHAAIAYDKKLAIYKCCLYEAGFKLPANARRVKFYGDAGTVNEIVPDISPHSGISVEQAVHWFKEVYDAMGDDEHADKFSEYKRSKEKDFFDEDMLALLVFLTRKPAPGKQASYSGFRLLKEFISLHTELSDSSFENEILKSLRKGKIVIIDLAQGEERIRNIYSEKITRKVFEDSMDRFTKAKPNNYIQFYFEEAHNLFPKKDDRDLGDVYNRLAKEGAKLHLGMTYATQEVSSISSNILKNTQNWFIAHLNNDDETKEIKKYYDFGDFVEGLVRFSASNDKGFVRMKTYSNPFVVPVQIDRFPK